MTTMGMVAILKIFNLIFIVTNDNGGHFDYVKP
jgi:hypothetical protein